MSKHGKRRAVHFGAGLTSDATAWSATQFYVMDVSLPGTFDACGENAKILGIPFTLVVS